MSEMEFLLQTLDLPARHALYFLCIFVPFSMQNIYASESDIALNVVNLRHAPGTKILDYEDDYWIGPVPQDYSEVNEKRIERNEFQPAKFKFTGRNNVETKVFLMNIHHIFNERINLHILDTIYYTILLFLVKLIE